MSLAGKIFAVICLIAAVFYAGITAALMSLQENYKQKWADEQALHARTRTDWEDNRKDLEGQVTQLKGEVDLTKKTNIALRGENQELRKEWDDAARINKASMLVIEDQEDQIALLNTRNDRYNDDLKAARADIDARQAEIDGLNKKNDEMLKNRDALQDLLTVRERDLTNATKELEKVVADFTVANDMLQLLKERDPQAYTDLLKPTHGQQPKIVIRGKVTGVDKSLGLVILNIGQRHQVAKGYSFIVFRGDEYIGKIIVDEVFPDMSATHYSRPDMKGDVEVGDDVTTRLTIDL
ncbi:MAG TPA: hypothetical protein VNE39_24025 [Planctomycetota bacterium]|nr:hypothetical protein [Planctomycetota bacterium]